MFDGIGIFQSSTSQKEFEANKNLDFQMIVSERTGEIRPYKKAEVKGITIMLRDGWAPKINGSLHLWHNNGNHNCDDFTRGMLSDVIGDLSSFLKINPRKEKITSLEIGVNLKLLGALTANEIVESQLCHKKAPFYKSLENKWYLQASHLDYILKVYNKSLQYGLDSEVLRHELKILRMRYLHENGITVNTMSDLLCNEYYPAMGNLLTGHFKKILFKDSSINPDELNIQDRILFLQGINREYWASIPIENYDSHTAYNAARRQQNRNEIKFRELSKPHWREEVLSQIESKWKELAFL